jgi:hypothetical protein
LKDISEVLDALMMEAINTSEVPVNLHKTTWHNIHFQYSFYLQNEQLRDKTHVSNALHSVTAGHKIHYIFIANI